MGGPLELQALRDRAEVVRSRVPVSSVVVRDIALEKRGKEMAGLCPFHHDTRLGSFFVNDGKAIYKCFACGAQGDVIDYVTRRTGRPFMDVLKELEQGAGIDFSDAKSRELAEKAKGRRERQALRDTKRRRANARELWFNAAPLAGTPAQSYLERRGIDFAKLGRFPGAIRFRPDVPNKELGRDLPAMLTAIHDAAAETVAVHRTWLAFDGSGWDKARLERPKMVLGDFAGGSIPLWKGDDRVPLPRMAAGKMVALSEGIEDGLTMALAEPWLRVHAAISLDNIGNVALPPQAGDLIVLGQRDFEIRARRAAAALAAGDVAGAEKHEKASAQITAALERAIGKQQERAAADGSRRDVRVAWPSKGFKDFNDELRGVRMEGA